MINIEELEPAPSILVEASNNIFEQLGNNTYNYHEVLAELIDNSIAAKSSDVPVTVQISIFANDDNEPTEIVVSDDATGISQDRLGLCITPAGVQSANSLNEHGLGMKQAISALGKLKYLATKTTDEEKARVVQEFKFGELPTAYADFDISSGTEISIKNIKPIVSASPTTYTRTIVPYLGARYRRFLKPDDKQLNLNVKIISSSDRENVLYAWDVHQVKPVYFHPQRRENRPVILRHQLQGRGWKALLTFGYAPNNDDEYEELGVDIPNKFHPYKVSISKQGLDVLLQNRVILFHQLSELGIVETRHSTFNEIRGEIVLQEGFSTAITKNSIINDDHFQECIDQITEILNGERSGPAGRVENYLRRKTYPDELPEKLLRDRLEEWLLNNPIQKRTHVDTEYVVEGIEGYIDILADEEAWEVKVDQASAYDVYQLFMYLDVGNFTKGYLVAKSFSTGAEIAARHIRDNHSKEINLAPRDQFPINHSPNAVEREEYF
ncbi:MAG: ATP-binding protein [Thermoleophilia bacterium]